MSALLNILRVGRRAAPSQTSAASALKPYPRISSAQLMLPGSALNKLPRQTLFRFSGSRKLHCSCTHRHEEPTSQNSKGQIVAQNEMPGDFPVPEPQTLGKLQQARMIIGFTCKVCDHRQHKYMSKKAYTEGVVIIRCDGCDKLHLMADHLGWFDSQNPPGTIEDILARKGQSVTKGSVLATGNPSESPEELAKRYERKHEREVGDVSELVAQRNGAATVGGADIGMMEFVAKEK